MEMEETDTILASQMLITETRVLQRVPAWWKIMPIRLPLSESDYELSQTEALIVAELARSIEKCNRDVAQLGRLLADIDIAMFSKLVQRIALWRYFLIGVESTLSWPKYPADVLVYVVQATPPQPSADFQPPKLPR